MANKPTTSLCYEQTNSDGFSHYESWLYMATYELVSDGLRIVSNKFSPRLMTDERANRLNIHLGRTSSMRWIPTELVDILEYVRADLVIGTTI